MCDASKFEFAEKTMKLYQLRHQEEFGHLVWSNAHMALSAVVSFVLGIGFALLMFAQYN